MNTHEYKNEIKNDRNKHGFIYK